jgi:hypothetical protein
VPHWHSLPQPVKHNRGQGSYPLDICPSKYWPPPFDLHGSNAVEEGMKLFPYNMVVTNGSLELPRWRNCVFNISVDGTKEPYEKIRGTGNYDEVKKNANRDDIHININNLRFE